MKSESSSTVWGHSGLVRQMLCVLSHMWTLALSALLMTVCMRKAEIQKWANRVGAWGQQKIGKMKVARRNLRGWKSFNREGVGKYEKSGGSYQK